MKSSTLLTASAALMLAAGVTGCGESVRTTADDIIPVPVSVYGSSGSYKLSASTTIGVADSSLLPAGNYLASVIAPATGLTPSVSVGEGQITLTYNCSDTVPGAYALFTSSDGVLIQGRDYAGVIHGISSLRQILPAQIESPSPVQGVEWTAPEVVIADHPAFEWRGIMLDVSRHFYTTDEVKELIDIMALYKLNKLHWHLTDDQGWRVEIKRYPLLTEKGAWRTYNSQDRGCLSSAVSQSNPDFLLPDDRKRLNEKGDTIYGGYYTQDEIRDIVAYAGTRGIDVVPEIDMPGHMLAAVSNYSGVSCFDKTGWGATFSSPVCPGKDSAMEFCKNVYDELIDLFPYEYVHIGGDEVEKTNWRKCPDCQKRIADNGLKNEEELQSWFIHQMEEFINSKGKKMIGWDEIIEGGLSPTATVMWWRSWSADAPAKATSQGNKVIFTPNAQLYLDYQEDQNSLANIIGLDFGKSVDSTAMPLVMGVQGNIWCEWIPSRERMQYMAVPRLLAIAELGWAGPSHTDIDAFRKRLALQFERLNIMNVNYRIPDLVGSFNTVNAFIDTDTLAITCLDPTALIRYTTDGSMPTIDSTPYTGPIPVTETTDFTLATFRPNGKRCNITTTRFVKETYSPATEVADALPGLSANWYDFAGNSCADIDSAPLKATYEVADISIPGECKGNIGLILTGYISIPADGIYTFALTSDDGSILTIDGATVVDNDGPHSPREIVAEKALARGLHPIELRYFDSNGGCLSMEVTGPDGATLTDKLYFRK